MRYVTLRHALKPLDVFLAVMAAFLASVMGPWAMLAALLVLVATGNLTIGIASPTAEQEQEPAPTLQDA